MTRRCNPCFLISALSACSRVRSSTIPSQQSNVIPQVWHSRPGFALQFSQTRSGQTPCAEKALRAGIWRFDAAKPDQHFSPASLFASGIRNAVGIAFDNTGRIFATQHGRDQLHENRGAFYSAKQGQELPAEELLEVTQSKDFGWPECYYDPAQRKLVLSPEYGGDGGKAVGLCAKRASPVAAFPAHWAPNAIAVYEGAQFPSAYRGGIFIAFHGSWNRAPCPQQGFSSQYTAASPAAPTLSSRMAFCRTGKGSRQG